MWVSGAGGGGGPVRLGLSFVFESFRFLVAGGDGSNCIENASEIARVSRQVPSWKRQSCRIHWTVHDMQRCLLEHQYMPWHLGRRGSLFIPARAVLQRSLHPRRRPFHNHPAFLDRLLQIHLSLHRPLLPLVVRMDLYPSSLRISFCPLQFPLDARYEVEIPVEARRRGDLTPFGVGRGITGAVALSPLLMALVAGQGTRAGQAARTAVLGGRVADGKSASRVGR